MSPAVFGANLRNAVQDGSLAFTANADMSIVTEQYQIGFIKAFEEYSDPWLGFAQPWDDAQGEVLLTSLKYAAENCVLKKAKGQPRSDAGVGIGMLRVSPLPSAI